MSRLRQKLFDDYVAHYAASNPDIIPTSIAPKTLRMMDLTYGPALNRVAQGGLILDAGCGTGFLLYWLQKRGGYAPVGVDVSPSMVEVVKKHLPGVEVHCTDAVQFMRERPGQFDAVFSTDVLEHVPDEELLDWVEIARSALKPGGVFVCKVPNAASLIGPHLRYIDLTHERSFTTSSLSQLLTAAGFKENHILPIRMAHLTGKLRMGAESILHRLVYVACGNARQRVFTSTLAAYGVRD
jgi:2-polyprenyl-3-methyl-5-hydroxy-6-metoxy-1,4-benzoquinol methylase